MSGFAATWHSSSITSTETFTKSPLSHVNAKALCHCRKKKSFFLSFLTHLKLTRQIPHQRMRPHSVDSPNLCGRYITLKLTVSPPSDSRHLLVLFISFLRPAAMCVTSRRSSTPSLSATCRSMWTRSSGCSRSAAASVTTLVWRRPTWRTTLVPDTQVQSPWSLDDWQSIHLRKLVEFCLQKLSLGFCLVFWLVFFLLKPVFFPSKQEAVFVIYLVFFNILLLEKTKKISSYL